MTRWSRTLRNAPGARLADRGGLSRQQAWGGPEARRGLAKRDMAGRGRKVRGGVGMGIGAEGIMGRGIASLRANSSGSSICPYSRDLCAPRHYRSLRSASDAAGRAPGGASARRIRGTGRCWMPAGQHGQLVDRLVKRAWSAMCGMGQSRADCLPRVRARQKDRARRAGGAPEGRWRCARGPDGSVARGLAGSDLASVLGDVTSRAPNGRAALPNPVGGARLFRARATVPRRSRGCRRVASGSLVHRRSAPTRRSPGRPGRRSSRSSPRRRARLGRA